MRATLDREKLAKALQLAARAEDEHEALAGLRGAYRILAAAGKTLDDVLSCQRRRTKSGATKTPR
jgi:hypothetical protein